MKYILFITALFLVSCFGKKPEKTGMEGKTLPDFSLQLADSTSWINTKDIPAGQSVAFFFFTPHCPYCKSQMSKIIEDIDALKNLPIFMITPSPFIEMKQFYNKYELSKYPNIKVARDTSNFFGQYLNVKGIPFWALYNKNRQLTRAFEGVTNSNLIRAITAE
jgi:thiol-disulfide isomerase/thioredoxin